MTITFRVNGIAPFDISFAPGVNGSDQLTAEYGDGLPGNANAITDATRADESSASGGLKSDEIVAAQALFPERAQTTVGRTRHRVFVNARRRREEARDEIIPGPGRTARDNHAPPLQPAQSCKVWFKRAHSFFVGNLR